MYQIIQWRKLWLGIASTLTVISIIFYFVWGLNLGIDFTGGSLLEVKFTGTLPAVTEIQETLKPLNLGNDLVTQPAGDQNMILRFRQSDEETHQSIMTNLKAKYGNSIQEERFESIGPSVGKELKTKAIYAVALALIGIVIYIAIAFRKVSWPVESWKYGFIAIAVLLHDVLIPIGVFALLGKFFNVEVGVTFIAAVLTIIGYSVNDTIVVFDRIRENLYRLGKLDFRTIVNRSVNETLARSINTTMTVLLALLAVAIFGGESVRYFAIALLIGVFCGAYSSIFIASPLLVMVDEATRKK